MKRTMTRRLPGLHEGKDLRVERVDGRWHAQCPMRDMGASVGVSTGVHEFHPDGFWTDIGSYRTLRLAEVARDLLKEGSRFVMLAHRTTCGAVELSVPTSLVTFEQAQERLVDAGLADSAPAP